MNLDHDHRRGAAATSRAASRPQRLAMQLALCLSFECGAVGPAAEAARADVGEGARTTSAAPFALDDAARIEAGRKRFNKTCAGYCHGFEGKGGRAPDFKGRTDLPPQFAFDTITNGRRGADVMPPWGGAFSAEQIWELVAYLQYLGQQPAD